MAYVKKQNTLADDPRAEFIDDLLQDGGQILSNKVDATVTRPSTWGADEFEIRLHPMDSNVERCLGSESKFLRYAIGKCVRTHTASQLLDVSTYEIERLFKVGAVGGVRSNRIIWVHRDTIMKMASAKLIRDGEDAR